jgi:hypothetical protein
MKLPSRLLRVVTLLLVSLTLTYPADIEAKGGKDGSGSGQKTVHVKG